MRPDVGAEFEIDLTGPAGGGVTVGRLPDGRACFVDYAIPGERVRVRITERRKRWARAELVEVIDASPDRVTPPCPVYGPQRCGGCRMQHVAPERQTALLATVITDQLRRIGRLDVGEVAVLRPHDGDGFGYRSRARFAVDGAGHLAFRRAGSTALQPVDDCPLLEPAGRELLGRSATGWDGAREVRVQLGDDGSLALAVTGDRGATPPQTVTTTAGHDAPHVWRTVAGRRFRVSARSFFQPSTAGATLLADLVRQHTRVSTGEHVVDCYAGVGLFSALLADDGAHVTAIERDAAACADARSNTAGLPVTVQRAEVGPDSTVPDTVDAVVLDPPRIGAGAEVMRWIAGMDPARVIYVSCDAATFARDARVLVDQRYALDHVVGVDQFTHTGHVEVVGVFHRPASPDRS